MITSQNIVEFPRISREQFESEFFKLPIYLKFFDCRTDDSEPLAKTHYGESLWSSERASYTMRMRLSWSERFDTEPLSTRFYFEARNPELKGELLESLSEFLISIKAYARKYATALENPSDDGGSVYYMPVALCICNYGLSFICDERMSAVTQA